jgi:hypothetical protein
MKNSKFKYVRFSLIVTNENKEELYVSITKRLGLPEGVPPNKIHLHKNGNGVVLFIHEDELKNHTPSYFVKIVKDSFIEYEKERFEEEKQRHNKLIKLIRKAKVKNHKLRYEVKE